MDQARTPFCLILSPHPQPAHPADPPPPPVPLPYVSGNPQALPLQDRVLSLLSSDSTSPSTLVFPPSHPWLCTGDLIEGRWSNVTPHGCVAPRQTLSKRKCEIISSKTLTRASLVVPGIRSLPSSNAGGRFIPGGGANIPHAL